jgi:hypothetical protein
MRRSFDWLSMMAEHVIGCNLPLAAARQLCRLDTRTVDEGLHTLLDPEV